MEKQIKLDEKSAQEFVSAASRTPPVSSPARERP